MQLGSPDNLFLLAFVEVLAIGFVGLGLWRRRASARFAGERGSALGARPYWLGATLVVAAATLAVIAMARPQWGTKEFSREQEGVDLVVVFDISKSMTAKDVQPSRIEAAQRDVRQLIEALRGNRIGLVFFAGTAILRSPLSTDANALSELVSRADTEPGLTRAGSDLGAALDQAGRILDASDSPSKAVLLVSDGEDHVGAAAARAAELAQRGIIVFTAGVGTPEGSTLTERAPNTGQTRTKVDAQGRPVITRLDEPKLQAAAEAGGGRYLRINGSGGSLLSLRDDLSGLQQTPLSDQTQRVPVERLQLFVGAALALLVVAWFLPARLPRLALRRLPALRPRPGLALLLLALMIGGACAEEDSVRVRNREANQLFASGQFDEALAAYEALLAERPDLPEIAFNAGNTLHRLEMFERAIEETRRALPPTTAKLGASSYYALGNHYLALDRLFEAYEAYKSALLLDPGDADAKYNIEVVLRLLNQEEEPPDQPPAAGQPGEGQPQGEQQPAGEQAPAEQPPDLLQPGGPNDQSGTPVPSEEQTPERSAADVQRALSEALAGIDDEVSFEEAQEILELLRELRQTQQPGPGPASGGLDY
jgi:Ca-activated chloride channel family protein